MFVASRRVAVPRLSDGPRPAWVPRLSDGPWPAWIPCPSLGPRTAHGFWAARLAWYARSSRADNTNLVGLWATMEAIAP